MYGYVNSEHHLGCTQEEASAQTLLAGHRRQGLFFTFTMEWCTQIQRKVKSITPQMSVTHQWAWTCTCMREARQEGGAVRSGVQTIARAPEHTDGQQKIRHEKIDKEQQ